MSDRLSVHPEDPEMSAARTLDQFTADFWREQSNARDVQIAALRAELATTRAQRDEARRRLKIVDNVCHSHHSASLVTWDGECPVCAEAGGVAFYVENGRIYRGDGLPEEK